MKKIFNGQKIVKTQCTFVSERGNLDYTLSRSFRRRTMAITIDHKALVKVAVPNSVSFERVHRFLSEKLDWIRKSIQTVERRKLLVQERRYEHGQSFLFLGKKYPLTVIASNGAASMVFSENGWHFKLPMAQQRQEILIKKFLHKWYRGQAHEILGGRVFYYARQIGVEPATVGIRTQKRLWGCCHYHKKLITLNWQIVLAPLEVIDYVVVHELCHLIYPNHSKRFWKKVEKIMPNYRQHKAWLRDHYLEMMLP